MVFTTGIVTEGEGTLISGSALADVGTVGEYRSCEWSASFRIGTAVVLTATVASVATAHGEAVLYTSTPSLIVVAGVVATERLSGEFLFITQFELFCPQRRL